MYARRARKVKGMREFSKESYGSKRAFLPGGTEENHENINQDIRSLDRDFNPGPPEYTERVLPV
jgi:hypothetical protein